MFNRRIICTIVGGTIVLCVAWQLSVAQQAPGKPPQSREGAKTKFEFEVIESFNSKYLGDTPGHRGKAGGLEGMRINVALGDSVFRENTRIGKVTALVWSSVNGVLEVEFDPEPLQRISIGDRAWIAIDGTRPGSQ